MGQSAVLTQTGGRIDESRCVGEAAMRLSIFLTDFGWFGLLGRGRKITRLTIGHVSGDGVREAMAAPFRFGKAAITLSTVEADWFPELRRRLERYAQGQRVDFRDCRIELPPRTPFQKRVLELTRRIGYGETVTYGRLAKMAGRPRAARAVGSVMATNTVPIVIPCHRVVAAGGKPGGFSAPQGIGLKEQMLATEARASAFFPEES